MINNTYNNFNTQQNNVSYGSVKDVVPNSVTQKLPENIQNLDAKEIASNNGAVGAAEGMSPQAAALSLPIYAALVGLRSVNDAQKSPFSFAGEYEKSFLGKLAKLGDKISNGIKKAIPEKLQTGFSTKTQSAKNWLQGHSAAVRSFSTPLKLENKMALQEANGLFGRVMYDNSILFDKGFKGDVKKLFKGDGTGKFWKYLVDKGIETKSGKEATSIVSEAFTEICNNPVKSKEVREYVDDIIKALSKSKETFVIDKWGSFNMGKHNLGIPVGKIPVINKIFTLKVPASEMANKLKVAAGLGGATALGKGLPSFFAKVYEGLTSNYVGGKIAPLMQAYFLAQAAMKAKDAPKGQKLATFMDEESSAVAFLFTMPMATSIMTKTGGLKYLGMGKTVQEQVKNVDKYRELIKNLNSKVDAKAITRGEYLNEVKNIKNLLKGDAKWYQKPIKWLGNILGSCYKNETIKPFIENNLPKDTSKLKTVGLSVANKAKDLLYKLKTKGSPGGALRFVLAFFILSPLVSKPIQWAVNKIFGKPYKPEEENKADEKAQNDAQANNPFLNMSDEELMNLLNKNQDTMAQIQNNPELMKELQTNPQKLYELLQQGAKENQAPASNSGLSPIVQNYINANKAPQAQMPQMPQAPQALPPQAPQMPQPNTGLNQNDFNQGLNNNAKMPEPSFVPNNQPQAQTPQVPRSYIPSSAPADFSAQQKQQDQNFQNLLKDMDNTEKEFSKYLSL